MNSSVRNSSESPLASMSPLTNPLGRSSCTESFLPNRRALRVVPSLSACPEGGEREGRGGRNSLALPRPMRCTSAWLAPPSHTSEMALKGVRK